MNLILSLIQLFVCMGINLKEYKNKSISIFFWAILLVIFSIPHTISVILGYNIYGKDTAIKASLFFLGFQTIYIITRLVILNKSKKFALINDFTDEETGLETEKLKINFDRYFYLNIIVGAVFLIYLILRFGRLSGFSWGEIYLASVNKSTLKDVILENLKNINQMIYFSVTGLIVICILSKKKIKTIILGTIILFYSMTTRNRITLLPLLVGIILVYVLKNKKITIKQLITLSLLGIFSVYIVYAILIFRHSGTINSFVRQYSFKEFNEAVFDSILNGDGELGLRNIFYYFINNDNNFEGFNEGATYKRILFMFVPTKLSFGMKPKDFAITMSSAYTGDIYNTTYSVHPTFLGDAYANFSWYGIFLGIIMALVMYILDNYIYKREYIDKILLMCLWGTCLIIIGRGSVYNGTYIGVMSTIIISIISLFKNKKIKRR